MSEDIYFPQEQKLQEYVKDTFNKEVSSNDVYYIRVGCLVAIHFVVARKSVFLVATLNTNTYILKTVDCKMNDWVICRNMLFKLFTDKYGKDSEFSKTFKERYEVGKF